MSAGFNRDRLPAWPEYADQHGLVLDGRGRWQTTRCDMHGGSDSLRVNVQSGGWRCMSCEASGGDTLAHYRATTGADFEAAARALGAWVEGGNPRVQRPARLAARDALESVGLELGVCAVVVADARSGIVPSDEDWQRFLQAAGRVEFIAREAST